MPKFGTDERIDCVDLNCTGNATFSGQHVRTSNLAADLEVPSANTVHRIFAGSVANQSGTVAAERKPIHIATAPGEIVTIRFSPTQTAAVGDSTVTCDIYKNGSSILTGTVQIDSGDAARAKVSGTPSSTTYVAGDVFESVVTVSAGTGTLPVGLGVDFVLDEDPS